MIQANSKLAFRSWGVGLFCPVPGSGLLSFPGTFLKLFESVKDSNK